MQNIYDYRKFSYKMFILYFYFQPAHISDLELFDVFKMLLTMINIYVKLQITTSAKKSFYENRANIWINSK